MVGVLRDARRVLRGADFDHGDEAERGRERNARLALAAATGVAVRGCSFLVNIASIALLYRYFDSVTFGIWLTLTSMWMILMLISDLGVGGGILNETARAWAARDSGRLVAVYSSGQVILCLIGAGFAALIWTLALTVPWDVVLKVPSGAPESDFRIGLGMMGTAIALMVASALFTTVKSGQQSAHEANLWSAFALVCGLAAAALAAGSGASFAVVAAAFYLTPAFVLCIALVRFLVRLPAALRPRASAVDPVLLKALIRTGTVLFALKLLTGLTTFSDGLLISAMLGPEKVQDVAVPARLFNIVTLGVTLFITPLWPIYAHAIASGDAIWVRRTFARSMGLVLFVGAPLSAFFVFAHPWILALWLGDSFRPDPYIVAGLAITCLLEALGTACAMLLNAGQRFRVQLLTGVAFLVASVSLRIIALKLFGTSGVTLASAIAYGCTIILPTAFVVYTFLRTDLARPASAAPAGADSVSAVGTSP
jgi:O-antigen/teichoic acid export membrane protein